MTGSSECRGYARGGQERKLWTAAGDQEMGFPGLGIQVFMVLGVGVEDRVGLACNSNIGWA